MPDRLVPTYAGFTFSGLMAMVDLNFGAIAGGLTVVGTAFLALSWQSSKNKVEAFKSMEAAKLQAKRDLDEYMKGSISNKLDSLQGSVDEAKDLATQRSSVITDLKLIIDTMRTRVRTPTPSSTPSSTRPAPPKSSTRPRRSSFSRNSSQARTN